MNAHGGLTRENGDRFRKMILSRGRTEEPSDLFLHYYGKAPDVQPLLEYRGLAAPGKSSPSGSGKGKSK
jgi:peptidyl-dipeptidase Dcp